MFKIGDIVEALESSNGEYDITNKRSDFVGEVIDTRVNYLFNGYDIKVRITKNKREAEIGEKYWVEPQYFVLHKNNKVTINRLRGK